MNKELEEAIQHVKRLKFLLVGKVKEQYEKPLETLLKELERLQEENKKMQTEIAEHVYWDSTPVNEIKKMYIPKDKIKRIFKDLKRQYKEHLGKNSTKAFILKCQIEIVQELLEDI